MEYPLSDNQKKAVSALKPGCVLRGDVGSGKTRTSLVYYWTKMAHESPNVMDLVIITTAKKRDSHDWEDEIEKVIFKTCCKRPNYVVDSWNNIEKYLDVKYRRAFFIFDEQRASGSGKWSKVFIKIGRTHDWILLSATPGDRYIDYLPIFIANGFYRNRTEFAKRHIVYKPYLDFPVIDHYVDEEIIEARKKLITVVMDDMRRTKRNVETIQVYFDDLMYYDYLNKRFDYENGEPIASSGRLCSLLRKAVYSNESRVDATVRLLNKASRAIIFYNFNYELELLKEAIYKMPGFTVAEYNGRRHDDIPSTDCWAYLVQYNAGAEGWNCIETDTTIFYSDNYSYKIMEQSSGRIDRMNTPFTDLYYYHFDAHSPIERSIRKALGEKKLFNERDYVDSLGGEIYVD